MSKYFSSMLDCNFAAGGFSFFLCFGFDQSPLSQSFVIRPSALAHTDAATGRCSAVALAAFPLFPSRPVQPPLRRTSRISDKPLAQIRPSRPAGLCSAAARRTDPDRTQRPQRGEEASNHWTQLGSKRKACPTQSTAGEAATKRSVRDGRRADTEPMAPTSRPPIANNRRTSHRPQAFVRDHMRGATGRWNESTAYPRTQNLRSRCASRFQVSDDAGGAESLRSRKRAKLDRLSENAFTCLGTGTGVGCPHRRL